MFTKEKDEGSSLFFHRKRVVIMQIYLYRGKNKMEVLYEVRGENLLIFLPEELDHHNAKIITEQSDWYIISNQIKNIIFNFKRTNFMDSSGIGVIMGRYKLIKSLGGEITVTNINQSIDRIFTISGLYKLVNKTVTPSLTNW